VDAFEKALAHEKGVTQSIHRLYEMAVAEKHYPAMVLLHWFIEEQVEEEKIVEEILSQLRLGKGDPSTILILDKALKERK
jgi:ferritin